jgi:hypothetical protein
MDGNMYAKNLMLGREKTMEKEYAPATGIYETEDIEPMKARLES